MWLAVRSEYFAARFDVCNMAHHVVMRGHPTHVRRFDGALLPRDQ